MAQISLNTGTQSHFAAEGSDVQGQIDLDRLQDVTVTNVQNNQVLKYDTSQSQWVNTSTGVITTLEDLSDVTVTAVTNGQVIAYNSATSQWENASNTAPTTLASLTDVDITTPSNGQGLFYNTATSEWENQTTTVTLVDGGTY
jgi:hypothetical protein|tara:strand:- start:6533 stop:6961 length:429 start_codon:yes stop_codon:yes gene_type:complete